MSRVHINSRSVAAKDRQAIFTNQSFKRKWTSAPGRQARNQAPIPLRSKCVHLFMLSRKQCVRLNEEPLTRCKLDPVAALLEKSTAKWLRPYERLRGTQAVHADATLASRGKGELTRRHGTQLSPTMTAFGRHILWYGSTHNKRLSEESKFIIVLRRLFCSKYLSRKEAIREKGSIAAC